MSALITLLDASAKGRRSAVANVAQGFALLAREHVIPACLQVAMMRADDVDARSWLNRWKLQIERVERTGRGAHGHVGDVQIARRGFQIGMAEQIWIVRKLVPDSSRCVAKAWRSECGCTGFKMPARRAALRQARKITLGATGRALCSLP
jgi:hypothetical protein